MEKIKKIAKYVMNILSMISALIVGLDPIWNIPNADKLIQSIAVITGVIGTYLLGQKVIASDEEDYKIVSEVGMIQTLNSSLRIRKAPSTKAEVIGMVDAYTNYGYTEVCDNNGYKWLHIASGWIAKTDDVTDKPVRWLFPTDYIAVTTYFKPNHLGIDLGYNNERGFSNEMPIKAIADGYVTKVWDFNDAGLTIRVRTDVGKYSFYHQYKHLSKALVNKGDVIKVGDVIGHMGKSGGNYGSHLHLDVVKCPLGYDYQQSSADRPIYSIDPLNIIKATKENTLSYDTDATKGVIYE